MLTRVALFLWFIPSISSAQSVHDIESLQIEIDKEVYGKIRGDVFSETGAEDLFTYSFGLQAGNNWVSNKKLEKSISLSGRAAKSERNENAFKDEAELNGKWVHYFSDHFGYETFADYFRDPFQLISRRHQVGAGLRIRLLGLKENMLIVGSGVLYESENVLNRANEQIGRFRFYGIFHRAILDQSTLSLTIAHYPDLELVDSRFVAQMGLNVPMNKMV
ncbi:MAG: DUF481 domain-containing protein [Pseudomonadota bacterium]